jgi:hypothetical protein
VFIRTARAGGTPYDVSLRNAIWDITSHGHVRQRGKKHMRIQRNKRTEWQGEKAESRFVTVFTVCGFPQALQLKIRTIPNVTPWTFLFMFSVITVH